MTVVVGVDVGGSGLRVQVQVADAVAPGPVRTAPGVRIGLGGIDVGALTHDAVALADLSGPPDVVVWSMRGLLFLADREAVLRQVVASFGARRTVVVSDAVANLVGAVGALRPAAVVAAGTGAVAFGTDYRDVWRRVDGWGHVLGDHGSAAVVGLEGLRAALRSADGLPGGSAVLLAAAVERFGPAPTWPRQVMTGSDAPELLAGFAPVVTGTAEQDAVAAAISRRAGESLALSLLTAAEELPDAVLTATGGLLAAPAVADALRAAVAEAGRPLVPARGGALEGTHLLARHLLETGAVAEHPTYLLLARA